jgi:hypothetical protein
MKSLSVAGLCVACAAFGFLAARLSAPSPVAPLCPAAPSCPPPLSAVPPSKPGLIKTVQPLAAKLAPEPTFDPSEAEAALRRCVGSQRAHAGSSIVLLLATDATGKVRRAEVRGGDFLSEVERRCVQQRAKSWQLGASAEEILIHVSL